MADIIYTYENPTSQRDVTRICIALEQGAVIAYPTDVNWALGCDFQNVKAVERIKRIKPQRDEHRPFSIVCYDIAMASEIVAISHAHYRMLRKALPGPYTLIMERNRNLVRTLKDKRKAIGIRIPLRPLILDIVKQFGRPLASTTAPRLKTGENPHYGYQIEEGYGHAIDLIVDLGVELPAQDSTIVDLTEETVKLVRAGAGELSPFPFDDLSGR